MSESCNMANIREQTPSDVDHIVELWSIAVLKSELIVDRVIRLLATRNGGISMIMARVSRQLDKRNRCRKVFGWTVQMAES